jgi:hypothetical protein
MPMDWRGHSRALRRQIAEAGGEAPTCQVLEAPRDRPLGISCFPGVGGWLTALPCLLWQASPRPGVMPHPTRRSKAWVAMLPRTSWGAVLVLLSLVVHAGADCIWRCTSEEEREQLGEVYAPKPWRLVQQGKYTTCGLTSVCGLNSYCLATTPDTDSFDCTNFFGTIQCGTGGAPFCSNKGCGFQCQPCPAYRTREG